MSGLTQYFPNLEHLTNSAGDCVPLSSLDDKMVLLYFAACWCPPCRGFTPLLMDFYEHFHELKQFEVVFVSRDEDAEDYEEYISRMPWLSVPFGSSRDSAAKELGVDTIPTLLVVEGDTGKIVSRTARMQLTADPEAINYPWLD